MVNNLEFVQRAYTPASIYALDKGSRKIKLIKRGVDRLTNHSLAALKEKVNESGVPVQFYQWLDLSPDPNLTCAKVVDIWFAEDDLWGTVITLDCVLGKKFDEILGKSEHLEMGVIGPYTYNGKDDWQYTTINGFRFFVNDKGYREGSK